MVTGYSAKNWSSLALIGPAPITGGPAPIAGPTVIEDRHVLGHDLAFGERNRNCVFRQLRRPRDDAMGTRVGCHNSTRRRFQEETAWRASARNWSSLALIGPASIAGTPSVEKHDVLRPNLTCGRWKRRNVNVLRYAP
jgi:hypothetical protein